MKSAPPHVRGAFVAKALATAFGAGYSPVAPGTCGTAVAVPIAFLLAGIATWQFVAVAIAVTAIAILSAHYADRAWGTEDSQKIVIDEVAGYLVTMIPAPRDHWAPLLAGFIAFRFFDIVKPPPVRWLDDNLPGGWGVVLDDIAAGVMAGVVMGVATYFGAWDAIAGL
ncbi:MAG: phosphatidylglycerophosphatase A [Deltaproteobacteria bacterium]|nr:phosphatidylglycerophosphatase A [Deltaproteobacteria bacterium]